jgi:large subunit ribosomal protein L18
MAALRAVPGVAIVPQALSFSPQFGKQTKREGIRGGLNKENCSLSWSSTLSASNELFCPGICTNLRSRGSLVVEAAWTRRSKGQPSKNKKSWKQRTEKYFKPFILDVFISSKYVHAKVMHRVTSSVVSVATTSSKDLKNSLQSLVDYNACKVVGKLIAERSLEADVYAVAFDLRKNEKLEGKLAVVIDSIIEHGLTLV